MRWFNLTAALLCLLTISLYLIIHFPIKPSAAASVMLYATYETKESATSFAIHEIPLLGASASVHHLDAENEIEVILTVDLVCPIRSEVAVSAMTSPSDAEVATPTVKEHERAYTEIACEPGQRQHTWFEVTFDADDVVYEESPGDYSFALYVSTGIGDTPIKMYAALDNARFTSTEYSVSSSTDRAEWSGERTAVAKGQFVNPTATSRIQVLDSMLLLFAGALAGMLIAGAGTSGPRVPPAANGTPRDRRRSSWQRHNLSAFRRKYRRLGPRPGGRDPRS